MKYALIVLAVFTGLAFYAVLAEFRSEQRQQNEIIGRVMRATDSNTEAIIEIFKEKQRTPYSFSDVPTWESK